MIASIETLEPDNANEFHQKHKVRSENQDHAVLVIYTPDRAQEVPKPQPTAAKLSQKVNHMTTGLGV